MMRPWPPRDTSKGADAMAHMLQAGLRHEVGWFGKLPASPTGRIRTAV